MAKKRPQYILQDQGSSPKVNPEFTQHLQSALLLSLLEQNLLTLPQYEGCIAGLKKQNT